MKFYAALESNEKTQFVSSTLCPEIHFMQYRWRYVLHLSMEDEFLPAMMKLGRNNQNFQLVVVFVASPTSVSSTIVSLEN